MTMQNCGRLIIPGWLPLTAGQSITVSQTTLDANGEYCYGVFRIPKTGTLHKIGVRMGSVVTTKKDIVITLETVDGATGMPSGSLYVANATGTLAEADVPNANLAAWVPINGATGVSVTRGDVVAIKCLPADGANLRIVNGMASGQDFHYTGSYTGSTNAFSASVPNFGLEYTAIESGQCLLPAVIPGTAAFGNNDDPERRGLVFQLPFKASVCGVLLNCDFDGDANIVLYDSDQATALETIAIDKDVRASASSRLLYLSFAASHALTINTNYRISIEPTSSTDVTLPYLDVTDDGAVTAMSGMDGCGVTWMYTTAADTPVNEASWTNTATRRPAIGLVIDQLDDGVSAGGASAWGF